MSISASFISDTLLLKLLERHHSYKSALLTDVFLRELKQLNARNEQVEHSIRQSHTALEDTITAKQDELLRLEKSLHEEQQRHLATQTKLNTQTEKLSTTRETIRKQKKKLDALEKQNKTPIAVHGTRRDVLGMTWWFVRHPTRFKLGESIDKNYGDCTITYGFWISDAHATRKTLNDISKVIKDMNKVLHPVLSHTKRNSLRPKTRAIRLPTEAELECALISKLIASPKQTEITFDTWQSAADIRKSAPVVNPFYKGSQNHLVGRTSKKRTKLNMTGQYHFRYVIPAISEKLDSIFGVTYE